MSLNSVGNEEADRIAPMLVVVCHESFDLFDCII